MNSECMFFEINLKKYVVNSYKDNTLNFINHLGSISDHYMPKYENLLLLGDFNSKTSESIMKEFIETYDLKKLIKEPTYFKSLV